MDVEAGALYVAGEFALDFFAALGGAHDYAVGAELLFVVGEAGDADLRLAEEAVADRGVAGGEAAKGELQRLAVEDAYEPADGPDEARAFQASPGHGAWPGEVVDHAGKNFEQQFVGGAAALGDFGGDVFALGSLHQVDRVKRDTLAFGETDGGASGGSGGVVGDGFGRAGDFIFDV